jgi:tight adherence protein C
VAGVLGGVLGGGANGLGGAVFGLIAGALFGFFLPFGILYDVAARRQQRITRELPDALDLLTLSVEAGLGFDAALAQVAATMPGPLAREIARALHEMQMGMRRADALRALGGRTQVAELRTVSTAVVQAGELGIPIAAVLREQASEMRLKRRQRAEEQAQKVPVKVTVPLILCLFPALFIVVIGPAAINIMHTFLNK